MVTWKQGSHLETYRLLRIVNDLWSTRMLESNFLHNTLSSVRIVLVLTDDDIVHASWKHEEFMSRRLHFFSTGQRPSICTSTFWYIAVVFLSLSLRVHAGTRSGKDICEDNSNLHKTSSYKYDGYDIQWYFWAYQLLAGNIQM